MRGCEQTRPRARAKAEADHSSTESHLSSTAVCGRGGDGRSAVVAMTKLAEPSRAHPYWLVPVRGVRVRVLGVSAPRMLPKV